MKKVRKEGSKGKHPYIVAIIGGAPRANLTSKGIMKRKVIEMMVVYHKKSNTPAKVHDCSMLTFWDPEKTIGIPNENPPL